MLPHLPQLQIMAGNGAFMHIENTNQTIRMPDDLKAVVLTWLVKQFASVEAFGYLSSAKEVLHFGMACHCATPFGPTWQLCHRLARMLHFFQAYRLECLGDHLFVKVSVRRVRFLSSFESQVQDLHERYQANLSQMVAPLVKRQRRFPAHWGETERQAPSEAETSSEGVTF